MRAPAFTASSLAALLLAGCLRPAEERASLDSKVGFASAGGVDFHVRDGLAAVRAVSDGSLVLWAQSPVLELELASSEGATEQWSLQVLNSMPGSSLSAMEPDASVAIEPSASDSVTSNRFLLHVPAGDSATLQLAPSDSRDAEPFTFAVLGDIQDAVDQVGDIYARMNTDSELRFVASTGDLTERGTGEQLDEIQRSFGQLGIPFYSTLGNHELGGDPLEWHRRFGRGSFHWGFHGVRLTFLDSANAGLDPLVYDWLRLWLDEGRDHCLLVFTHFPPIDPVGTRSGSFRDRQEAAMYVGMLADGRVDSAFHGHIHSFYAYSLGGVPAYISGGGGAIPERFDGIGRHYLRVTADPSDQTVEVSVVRVD